MKKHFYIAILLFLFPVFLCTCHKKEDGKTEDQIPPVEVVRPEVGAVTLSKTLPGTLQSSDKVEIVCRVNGKLTAKHVEPGQRVSKGQLLYSIESTQYRDAVERASASLNSARSQYEYALSHAEALEKAYKADAVAKMQVLEAQNAVRVAREQIHTAEAALNDARTQLGYCSITAPISGIVSDTPYSTGSYISGEGEPAVISTVYNNDNLKVVFGVEESQYKTLPEDEEGMYDSIPLTFREPTGRAYTARLSYRSPTVDASTGLLTLQGKVNNPGGELRDGMFCSISLPTGFIPDAILVRDASVGTDQLGKYLYVVNDSDRIVKRHIEAGQLWRDSLRVVTKGITSGDRYVKSALLSVREGERVRPIETK